MVIVFLTSDVTVFETCWWGPLMHHSDHLGGPTHLNSNLFGFEAWALFFPALAGIFVFAKFFCFNRKGEEVTTDEKC